MYRRVTRIRAQGGQRGFVGRGQVAPREGFARTLQRLLQGSVMLRYGAPRTRRISSRCQRGRDITVICVSVKL